MEPVFQLLQPVTSAVTPSSTAARRKLFSATELLGRQTVASAVMLIDVLFERGIGFLGTPNVQPDKFLVDLEVTIKRPQSHAIPRCSERQ